MGKTGGDKMRAVEQQGRSVEERKKGKAAGGVKALEAEAARLRDELGAERKRMQALQDTSSQVADRLDAAIDQVKAILARQG